MENKINCSILINSCDNYEDIWYPFFTLFNRYFKTNMDVYISTETKDCPYAKTIKKNYPLKERTARIRESLKEIPTKYVIVMDEDNFISNNVNIDEIKKCIEYMDNNSNIAQFNFEPTFDKSDKECQYEGWLKRNKGAAYVNSFQPSIHNREILIKRLSNNMDGWDWEMQRQDIPYDVYISKKENRVIKYGKELDPIYGIFRGKWYKPHVVPLFEKENIKVDFSKRGFYGDVKISIIIPLYNTANTIDLLLKNIDNQYKKCKDNIEVIIVNDGSTKEIETLEKLKNKYTNFKFIDQDNKGVSSARNRGLKEATGKYISFIDSDDNVSNNYIKSILNKINASDFDYCFFSWQMTNKRNDIIRITNMNPNWNTCVWNCIYKKEKIGLFDEKLQIGEDEDFNKKYRKGKKEIINDILYYYNVGREDGLITLYRQKKIDRTIDNNSIKTQILIYQSKFGDIGGIERNLYEFFTLNDKYDIIFMYKEGDIKQLARYKERVKCIKYTGQKVICNKYICHSAYDNIADNVTSLDNYYAQVIHSDYDAMNWKYNKHPKTNIHLAVSEVAKNSIIKQAPNVPCRVIYNSLNIGPTQRVLNLISATRFSWEKGYDITLAFAKRLNERNIPFIWQVFTNKPLKHEIEGLIRRNVTFDIDSYIKDADYLLQLSRCESWGYSTAEAFELGTPVIATDYPAIYEQGMEIGKNGFVLKQDLSNLDEVIDNMLKSNLKFKYIKKDNIQQWIDELGDMGGKQENYIPEKIEFTRVRSLKKITFTQENIDAKIGTRFDIYDMDRLDFLVKNGYVEIIK